MMALWLAIVAAALGHMGEGRHLAPLRSSGGFLVADLSKISRPSRVNRLLRARRNPASRVALTMRATDKAIGLLQGCFVYFDSDDCHQIEAEGLRRPIRSSCWKDIKRFADVKFTRGVPEVSDGQLKPAGKAVGVLDGRCVHLDGEELDGQGGYIMEVDGQWRPILEEHFDEVQLLGDVYANTTWDKMLDGCADATRRPADELVNRTFIWSPSLKLLYQVVKPGTGAAATQNNVIRYRFTEWRRGFPGDETRPKAKVNAAWRPVKVGDLISQYDNVTWAQHDTGYEEAEKLLPEMRVGEVRRAIILRDGAGSKPPSTEYVEMEVLGIE
ncbi:unnamed protein product [Vitrella brassicaformis CCMP3155]|uniref:Peptidylprolyl isomerase n=1 Tax=Vitrella brassicaformis (strain CCMP3155) TaxID=1169540 RepID=A0A0G4H4Y0_VITBC|nr:unnamed protein product [Vitrella brassicaformis CCMP3155]|eukprot:CEM38737.1 unnamed protein product [Vitrella brassicaformis CCMP3155]